jgi:hypothetical protein
VYSDKQAGSYFQMRCGVGVRLVTAGCAEMCVGLALLISPAV